MLIRLRITVENVFNINNKLLHKKNLPVSIRVSDAICMNADIYPQLRIPMINLVSIITERK